MLRERDRRSKHCKARNTLRTSSGCLLLCWLFSSSSSLFFPLSPPYKDGGSSACAAGSRAKPRVTNTAGCHTWAHLEEGQQHQRYHIGHTSHILHRCSAMCSDRGRARAAPSTTIQRGCRQCGRQVRCYHAITRRSQAEMNGRKNKDEIVLRLCGFLSKSACNCGPCTSTAQTEANTLYIPPRV